MWVGGDLPTFGSIVAVDLQRESSLRLLFRPVFVFNKCVE